MFILKAGLAPYKFWVIVSLIDRGVIRKEQIVQKEYVEEYDRYKKGEIENGGSK